MQKFAHGKGTAVNIMAISVGKKKPNLNLHLKSKNYLKGQYTVYLCLL